MRILKIGNLVFSVSQDEEILKVSYTSTESVSSFPCSRDCIKANKNNSWMTLGLEISMQSRASPSCRLNYRLLCSSRSKTTCSCSNTDHKNTILCEKEIKNVDIHINNLDGNLEHMHRKQIYTFYGRICMLKGTY